MGESRAWDDKGQRRFPWGNDPTLISQRSTRTQTSTRMAAIKGEVDGYNRWSPVDAMTGDKSPYGVMDMAGNVSEWTADVVREGQHRVTRSSAAGTSARPDVEVIRRV